MSKSETEDMPCCSGTAFVKTLRTWTYPPEGTALPSTTPTSCLARPGGMGRGPGALPLDPRDKDPPLGPPLTRGFPPPMLDWMS